MFRRTRTPIRIAFTWLLSTVLVATALGCGGSKAPPPTTSKKKETAADLLGRRAKAAKEAYLLAYPMLRMYGTMATQAVEESGPQYLAAFNTWGQGNTWGQPPDKAGIDFRRSDVIESFAWLDLRKGTVKLEAPRVAKRYYTIQVVDLQGSTVAYLGTSSNGGKPESYQFTGPHAAPPEQPEAEKKASPAMQIRAGTDFVVLRMRMQVLSKGDVKRAESLSKRFRIEWSESPQSTGKEETKKEAKQDVSTKQEVASAKAESEASNETETEIPLPVWNKDKIETPSFIEYLNPILTWTTLPETKQAELKRFEEIGIGPGLPFDGASFDAEVYAAVSEGIRQALMEIEGATDPEKVMGPFSKGWATLNPFEKQNSSEAEANRNRTFSFASQYYDTSLPPFRDIPQEVIHLSVSHDKKGKALNGSSAQYELDFTTAATPKAKGFWTLALFDRETKQPVTNRLKRYSLSSTSKLIRKGGITKVLVQSEMPSGWAQKANWLPAPSQPFFLVLSIYGPDAAIQGGSWSPPPVLRIEEEAPSEKAAAPSPQSTNGKSSRVKKQAAPKKESNDDDGFSFSLDETE